MRTRYNARIMNAPVRKRRWILRSISALVAVTIVGVALAPSLLSWFPELRNWAARRLVGKVNGEVVVDSLSAGWFEPVVVRGFRIVHPSGEKIVDIEQIETDRVLWKMVTSPWDMGTIRIERPVVSMALRADGTNFNDVFAPVAAAPKPPRGLKLGVRARIVDGTFRCRSHEYADPWQITGINLGIGLRPASVSPSGKTELLVEKGYLLNHAEASIGLCNDLLSFVAPVLAKVAHAQGMVSIYLDDWRLPIDEPATGELGGMVTMHTVDAGPGPLVQALFHGLTQLPLLKTWTGQWQLPSAVQLARESQIPFQMVDGRIHHEGLKFSLVGLIDVATDGYVGLDKSLDLEAVIGFHPPNPEDRKLAVLRAVYSQPWPIHIRGKLGAPQPDLSPLGQAGIDLVGRTLDDIESGRPSVGGAVFNAINGVGIPITPGTVKSIIELTRPRPTVAAVPNDTVPKNAVPNVPPRTEGPALAAPQNNPTLPSDNIPPVVPPPNFTPRPEVTTPAPVTPTPAVPSAPLVVTPVPSATPSATAGPPGPTVGQQVAEGVGIAVDVLQALRQQREARRQQQLNGPPPNGAAPNGAAPPPQGPLGRRPLLRGGLRSILEAVDEATQPPPTPAPPMPTATPSPTAKPREF